MMTMDSNQFLELAKKLEDDSITEEEKLRFLRLLRESAAQLKDFLANLNK